MGERLQKYISAAGVASRRHAEGMIKAGRVKVNGKTVTVLGTKVDPTKDRVEVNGKKIFVQQKLYLAFNKPRRCVTTRHDPAKRKTVFDFLPPGYRNQVWPVGRLDFSTEGLLILTNDGEVTQILTHPSKEHEKEYEVVLDKEINDSKLQKIRDGIKLGGKVTSPAEVRRGSETKIYVTIHEGWNHQIKRMFAAIGFTVRNLKRVRVGKLKLFGLQPGEFKLISRQDLV